MYIQMYNVVHVHFLYIPGTCITTCELQHEVMLLLIIAQNVSKTMLE